MIYNTYEFASGENMTSEGVVRTYDDNGDQSNPIDAQGFANIPAMFPQFLQPNMSHPLHWQYLFSHIAPSGSVLLTAAGAAPDGWLSCNGTAISRTDFAALFTAIGTTFGNGDGTTTFNLPDLSGPDPNVIYIIKY